MTKNKMYHGIKVKWTELKLKYQKYCRIKIHSNLKVHWIKCVEVWDPYKHSKFIMPLKDLKFKLYSANFYPKYWYVVLNFT